MDLLISSTAWPLSELEEEELAVEDELEDIVELEEELEEDHELEDEERGTPQTYSRVFGWLPPCPIP